MAKKKQQPAKSCADCIHEFACHMWTDGRVISDESASRCPNYTETKNSVAYILGKLDAEESLIDSADDDFGAVLNCAVRYAIGRKTYMPHLVMDFIRPLLPHLSEKTLCCFAKDIEVAEREDCLGDPYIDAPAWHDFLGAVQKERNRRGNNG